MSTNGEATAAIGQLEPLHDEAWHQEVLDALHRAAKQAHLIAYQTGTGVVVHREGEVRVIAPDPAMYEDLIPPPFVEQPLNSA